MFKALWSISVLKYPDAGLQTAYYSLLAAFPSASIWIDTKEPYVCPLFYQWSKFRRITHKWSALISACTCKEHALFSSDLQHIQLSCIYTEQLSAVYLLASLLLSFLICPNELPALLTSALCNNTTNHTWVVFFPDSIYFAYFLQRQSTTDRGAAVTLEPEIPGQSSGF